MNCGEIDIKWEWDRNEPAPIHLSGFRHAMKRAWRAAYGDNCQDCARIMRFDARARRIRRGDYATLDHILAQGLGGSNDLGNLRFICSDCNHKKARFEAIEVGRCYPNTKRHQRSFYTLEQTAKVTEPPTDEVTEPKLSHGAP